MVISRFAFALAALFAPRASFSTDFGGFGGFNSGSTSEEPSATYIVSHHKSGGIASLAVVANICCREALNISVRKGIPAY